MRFFVTARSGATRSQWIEEFPSREKGLEAIPKRGWVVEEIVEVDPKEEAELQAKLAAASAEARQTGDIDLAAKDIILTTTFSIANRTIERELEIITAECVYGVNVFRDIMAGFRDLVGGRSEALQNVLRDARRTVLTELRREAHLIGADAVVGIRLDYHDLEAGRLVMLVASGTAVKLAA